MIVVPWQSIAPATLDDERWALGTRRPLVDVHTGASPGWPTTVDLVATERAMWVRFRAKSHTITATLTRYKAKLWREDAVEVYLVPPSARALYEFQINPIGTVRDLEVPDFGTAAQVFDDSWCCRGLAAAAAVSLDDTGRTLGWRAMFGIPWFELRAAPDEPGWRIAVFRLEKGPADCSGLVAARDFVDLHDPRLLQPFRVSAPTRPIDDGEMAR